MLEILQKFISENIDNPKIKSPKDLPNFIDGNLILAKAALEYKLKPRKFTLKEIEALLHEAYPLDMNIPKWYSDKWFKQNHTHKNV